MSGRNETPPGQPDVEFERWLMLALERGRHKPLEIASPVPLDATGVVARNLTANSGPKQGDTA